MYVTIDLDGMRFAHAHPDRYVCSLLADIELPHVAVAVLPIEEPDDLSRFTDLELKLLHRNATGRDSSGYSRPHLLRAVAAVALALDHTDATAPEVAAQAACIKPGDTGRYRYLRGASRPLPVDELFELTPVRCQAPPEALQARALAFPALTPRPAPAQPVAAPPRPAQAPPHQPRKAGATARVQAICDELAKAGPVVRSAVLSRCADEGINASTASVQFSKWKSLHAQ